MKRSYFLPLAALAAVTVLLAPPLGDFPLNDDWVYASMAKTLVEQHRFVPHVFTAAYAVCQTFWGAAFCAIFGYSFTVLRISTLVLSLVTVWLTARCARELGATRNLSLLCGVLVFANPLFLNLSYTFMTEVPYMAPMVASGFFYLRALRRGRSADLFLGSAFAVVSFCNRQYGVLSTVAFLGALVVAMRAPLWRPRLTQCVALFGPWAGLGFGFAAVHGMPGSPFHTMGLAGTISHARQIGIAVNVFYSLPLYIGLFLLPIAAGVAIAVALRQKRWTRKQWACFYGVTVFYVILMLIGVSPMPRLPNMLRDLGVGPLTTYDAYFAHPEWSPTRLAAGGWYAVTVLSLLAAATLAAHWFGRLTGSDAHRRTRAMPPVRRAQYWFLFLWGCLLLYSPLNPALTIYFDRYVLPGSIPLLLLAAPGIRLGTSNVARAVVLVPTVMLYAFSIASVQDYLSWNRARWEGISELRTKHGAADAQIDGGYEFNGLYTSHQFRALHPDRPLHYSGEQPWWVIEHLYAVSFLPRKGFVELGEIPYQSWLRPESARMLVLKRAP